MADYLIKDIPEDTMRDFKTACAWFKESMRQALIDGMNRNIGLYQADVMTVPRKQKTIKKEGKK